MARKNSRSDLITGAFALFVIACSVFVVLFCRPLGRGSRAPATP
ncbi:MAG: hypothetical protein HPKKFMNG_02194 [Planctomycetes bacterium]|nr:hypothetical protein [Planctomycetota bacterium]